MPWDRLAIEVIEIEGHGVSRARIRRITEPPPATAPPPGND